MFYLLMKVMLTGLSGMLTSLDMRMPQSAQCTQLRLTWWWSPPAARCTPACTAAPAWPPPPAAQAGRTAAQHRPCSKMYRILQYFSPGTDLAPCPKGRFAKGSAVWCCESPRSQRSGRNVSGWGKLAAVRAILEPTRSTTVPAGTRYPPSTCD